MLATTLFTLPTRLPCASIDGFVARWFRDHLTPRLADFYLALSVPGSEFCILLLLVFTALLLAWRRAWRLLALLALTVPGGTLLGEGLKLLVHRPRPFLAGPFGPWGGYSFPSGHTVAATVLYTTLLMFIFPLLRNRTQRLLALSSGGVLILGVAFSRVALGAHHVSDVCAGGLLGLLWVALCSTGVAWLRNRRVVRQPAESAPSPVVPARSRL